MACKAGVGVAQRHALGALKHLDNGLIPVNLYDTADFVGIASHSHLHYLIKRRILNALKDNQRAIDLT